MLPTRDRNARKVSIVLMRLVVDSVKGSLSYDHIAVRPAGPKAELSREQEIDIVNGAVSTKEIHADGVFSITAAQDFLVVYLDQRAVARSGCAAFPAGKRHHIRAGAELFLQAPIKSHAGAAAGPVKRIAFEVITDCQKKRRREFQQSLLVFYMKFLVVRFTAGVLQMFLDRRGHVTGPRYTDNDPSADDQTSQRPGSV
jgi:hypothetical protein